MHMEVGHAARNVYVQAVSLGLGTVVWCAVSTLDLNDDAEGWKWV